MSNIRFRFSSNESPFGAIFSHRNKSRLDSWIEIWMNSAKISKTLLLYYRFEKVQSTIYSGKKQVASSMGLTIKAMHEIFSKLQFHTCKLQFWHRLSLFIIDSLKIVSPKLIVTLSFCLFAEDQSRNLHHKFFNFQNKQARNLVKKKQTTRQEI